MREGQVTAAVELLDGGATVPFIARYRKEATGALDDAQLRTLEERLRYLRELDERRAAILESIRAQGKLDDALAARIMAADSKARLEDIYLPYKPKRRTKAQIAREAGLEPLADLLLASPDTDPEQAAADYVDAGARRGRRGRRAGRRPGDPGRAVRRGRRPDRRAAGADVVAGPAGLAGSARARRRRARSSPTTSSSPSRSPRCPRTGSWRCCAGRRKRSSTSPWTRASPRLTAWLLPRRPTTQRRSPGASASPTGAGRRTAGWGTPCSWAWRTRILVHLGVDLRMRLWQRAEDEAVRVFAANLRDLLLAAPAGTRATMGLDPGFRTGVKVAVVDGTGKAVATDTIYPHELRRGGAGGAGSPVGGVHRHAGPAGRGPPGRADRDRQRHRLARDRPAGRRPDPAHPELKLTKVVVSEAGASVYSASAYASRELPGMDVSLRGAVSIARRLQDPLAELVKIDPKSIGVGQYQHDLAEIKLSRSLDAVVEDCVNAVGVDVNTASAPLLARVSGIGEGLADRIVAHRDDERPVPQPAGAQGRAAAGAEGVRAVRRIPAHPRRRRPAGRVQRAPGGLSRWSGASSRRPGPGMPGLIGNTSLLRSLRPQDFTDERFGLPTVTDILGELEKPGRDPRPAFTTATFAEGVETLEDLAPGMVLEGVVTNVAAFGAFVDVGVHQDGLVHVSAMSRTFVSDPREVVKSGDVVRVKVLGVDIPRKRISLTLRLDEDAAGRRPAKGQAPGAASGGQGQDRDGRNQSGRGPGGGERGRGRDHEQRGQRAPRQERGPGGRGQGRQDQGGRDQGRSRDAGGPGQGAGAPGGGAMADALRRAGLVTEQPGPGRDRGPGRRR